MEVNRTKSVICEGNASASAPATMHENNQREPTSYTLPGTQIEIINDAIERGNIRHALFDFDGTISLIREGWQQVMIPLMVEILKETPEGKHEPEEQLNAIVTEFVTRLTGKQTIYQMIQLCEEIKKRGGEPLHPLEYKRIYHDRLMARIRARIEGLKRGTIPPEEMRLPGSLEMLKALRKRDVTLYLASGTDIGYVL